ncbi:MAG TPA: hypothetical protein ENN78_00825, partial [Candidatus Omnitrophica bacterium]|nr:hypothetical protein [Candidatus Omnitrophota bacterium]
MKKIILVIFLLFSALPAAHAEFERIVSLAPETTEILFSLGLDEEIVGVSSFCNYPAAALKKEQVGSFSRPNIEKIISLKPDLVLLTGLEQQEISWALNKLNIKTMQVYPSSTAEFIQAIEKLGEALNRQRQARAEIRNLNKSIHDMEAKIKDVPHNKRPKIYMEIWHDPLITAGGSSFLGEIIEMAGGINIAGQLNK